MIALATAIQHLTREERNIAFVFAGLPSISSKWLNDQLLTFLRRAQPELLGDIPLAEVHDAFADTFALSGMPIDGEALDLATNATEGYPFMIQLVGYNIWRVARKEQRRPDETNNGNGINTEFEPSGPAKSKHSEGQSKPTVSVEAAKTGVRDALARLGDTVHSPELDGLSAVDRTYLLAMAQDDGPSSTSVVAERMHKSAAYANTYRTRHLEAQVIKEAGFTGRLCHTVFEAVSTRTRGLLSTEVGEQQGLTPYKLHRIFAGDAPDCKCRCRKATSHRPRRKSV